MRKASMIAIAATLLMAAGCATDSAERRAALDRSLESSLRTELRRYGDLAATAPDVRFDADSGTVTITGTVPTEKDRDMITSLVRNTVGVDTVNDRLRVMTATGPNTPARVYTQPAPVTVRPAPVYIMPPPNSPAAPVVVVPSSYPELRLHSSTTLDQPIARAIAEQLATDGVSERALRGVTVSVSGAKAYVHGTVNSAATRQDIISAVSRAPGVTAVYDQLAVR